MGSEKKVTVGFRYLLGMHMILCHGPVDKIQEIRVGGRSAWKGDVSDSTEINIDKEGLFGGEGREGGVKGDVDIEMGDANQGQNIYLQDKIGDVPGFRGVLGLVLKQVYLGTIPRFKPWAITAQREPSGWSGAPSGLIGEDANPAHIIFEAITNHDWGMGYSESRVDTGSFSSAANTFSGEGFGLSFLWKDKNQRVEDFISDVLRYVDASLYLDPGVGKYRLSPHRDDYNVEDLAELNRDNVVEVRDFSRPGFGDLVNEITVVYTDGDGDYPSWQQVAISEQNQAAVRAQGNRTISQEKKYPAITTHALANRVLARDLQQESQPLARVELILLASESDVRPGDVRKWVDEDYGVTQLVIRIVEVDYGTLNDGQVRVKAVEDTFASRDAVFGDPAPTDWVDPVNEPAPAPQRRLTEATYYQVVREVGEAVVEDIPETAAYLTTQATRPSSDAFDYSVAVDDGSLFAETEIGDFAPNGNLDSAIGQADTVLDAADAEDLEDVDEDTYAYIGDEIVAVRSVDESNSQVTVDRGVIDTVPQRHSAGTIVFFAQDFESTDQSEYADGETIDVKILPRTGLGELDLASAPTDSITFDGRFIRPYPPGKFRIAGNAYPDFLDAPLEVTWAHRDRTQQTAGLIAQDEGDIGPEPGTDYTIKITDTDANNELHQETTSGTSYDDVSGADTTTETSAPPNIRIELWSNRDGHESWQRQSTEVQRRGYAFAFLDSGGDIQYGGFNSGED